MIISCTSCQTQFRVDEDRLVPDGKMVRCSKCGHVWRATTSGQPGSRSTPQPTPIRTDAPVAAGRSPQETPAPDHPAKVAAPALSAHDPVGEANGDGESEGQDTNTMVSVAGGDSGADGLTVEQRARLTAARQKKPRSRFWIKVLVVFIIFTGLLLLAQRMMPEPGLKKAGPAVEQPATDAAAQPAQ